MANGGIQASVANGCKSVKQKRAVETCREIFFFLRNINHWDIPFFQTSEQKISTIIKLAQIKPGQKAADLGSGDGRILMALAKMGVNATGYEIIPLRAEKSRKKIKEAGLEEKARVYVQDFWQADLSGFDVVIIYGVTRIMGRLQEKLEKESPAGTRIISHHFPFPGWKETKKSDNIYLYVKE